MTCLLDVNALIALIDVDHVNHDAMQSWFHERASNGWATCPITENGLVRILSQPKYPSGRRSPAELIALLQLLGETYRDIHKFWPDDVSIGDRTLFHPEFIVSHHQITDVYLLGLAARHGGKLVTFDRSVPWQAVVGGSPGLVENPGSLAE